MGIRTKVMLGTALVAAWARRQWERSSAERALRHSENTNRAILSVFPDLMFVLDREGRYRDYYMSPGGELYAPPEQFLGKTVHQVLPSAIAAEAERAIRKTLASRAPVSIEYSLSMHGETRYYEARMDALDADQVLTIVRDVTAGRRVADALEESRRFNERVGETLPNVLFVYDVSGDRITYVNDRSSAVTGYTPEEVIANGKRFFEEHTHPDDLATLRGMVKRIKHARDGEVIEDVSRFRHKNGEWRWFRGYGTVFTRFDDGRPKQILGYAVDITAMKHAEHALQALSARLLDVQDQERQRIARELHDGTSQVLFGIGASLATLRRRPDLPSDAKEMITDCQLLVEDSLTELRSLSYALHPPSLDQVGLIGVVRWFVDGFHRRNGIEVELEADDTKPRLPLNVEHDLFRVAQECLTNVARHSGSPRAVVRISQSPGEVLLQVRDFGRGMPLRDQRPGPDQPAGVGIGSMRERLRAFGGRLEIDSTPRGTTVSAIVPLRDDPSGTPIG